MVSNSTVGVILGFAFLFVMIGFFGPVLYAMHAPASYFLVGHALEAPNTTTGATTHSVCFERTVHRAGESTVTTELYRTAESNELDHDVEVWSQQHDRYVQHGRYFIRITTPIPGDLEAGRYYYKRIYTIGLANGIVERSFTFTSNTFTISDIGASKEDPLC